MGVLRHSYFFVDSAAFGITMTLFLLGMAVPVRFLAALCALNTGSGSQVSGSAILALFHSFCMWRSVLFLCSQLLIFRFATVWFRVCSVANFCSNIYNHICEFWKRE